MLDNILKATLNEDENNPMTALLTRILQSIEDNVILRAINAITTTKHFNKTKCWFPVVYIAGNGVFFNASAAQRYTQKSIEEIDIQTAWMLRYGQKMPEKETLKINNNIKWDKNESIR